MIAVGCSKKVAVKPPATPAAAQQAKAASPEKPVISLFAASPGSIDKGGETTLRWAVEHATNVKIAPALGTVQESGSRAIFPANDTVYTLTATGPGGSADATTSVSILVHRAAMPDQATKNRIQELLDRIQDAYFDYDKHNIRPDAQNALEADAKTLGEILKQYPTYKLTVQGYCDERGSEEYNLALGEKRALQAKEYLSSLGVPGDQLKTVSYGKEKQICSEHDEACWQKNRRAHITQEQ